MANQICRICPKPELVMLRLDEYVNEHGNQQVTAESAVQAVRAAIGMHVDIISMSWTIEQTEQNKVHIDQLTTVLNDAAKKNIFLFCSAPDKGADTTATYPAKCGPCINIGGAQASGELDPFVGRAPVDFLFPGSNVVASRHGHSSRHGDSSQNKPLNGSSVATALASGLAALTLYCVQFAVEYAKVSNAQGEYVRAEQLDNLRTRDGMKASFNAIGQNKYLEVWDVFGEAVKTLRSYLDDVKREAIVQVAKRLVHTKKLTVLSV